MSRLVSGRPGCAMRLKKRDDCSNNIESQLRFVQDAIGLRPSTDATSTQPFDVVDGSPQALALGVETRFRNSVSYSPIVLPVIQSALNSRK